MMTSFQTILKQAARSAMARYADMKNRTEALDGYSSWAAHEMAGGRGPKTDPTAGVVIQRQKSPDFLWLIIIGEALRSVSEPIRRLADELWIQPAIPPKVFRRYEKIADRLHISVSTLYSWRDQFLVEVGSRAYARGLIALDAEDDQVSGQVR